MSPIIMIIKERKNNPVCLGYRVAVARTQHWRTHGRVCIQRMPSTFAFDRARSRIFNGQLRYNLPISAFRVVN